MKKKRKGGGGGGGGGGKGAQTARDPLPLHRPLIGEDEIRREGEEEEEDRGRGRGKGGNGRGGEGGDQSMRSLHSPQGSYGRWSPMTTGSHAGFGYDIDEGIPITPPNGKGRRAA
uniref:Uncharacterized protein n=1 Tax=Palpitomonas bilix TaxID=652834 RepID=A0A7S3G1H3_9EUKA